MDYYTEKRMVFHVIEQKLKKSEQGIERNHLVYDLTMKYLIGESTINKRLDLMIDLGIITEDGGVLKWKQ